MGVALFIAGAVVVVGLIVAFIVLMRRSSARRAAVGTADIDRLVFEHAKEREREEHAIQEDLSDDAGGER